MENAIGAFLGVSVLSATIRLTTPVLFAAIGGCFGHKTNVLNIGLESFLAFSAFFAMCGSYWAQSALVGLLFGIAAGVMAAAVFAVFVLYFRSNAMVTGIAMNLAAWGITNFLLQVFFNKRSIFIDPRIKSFHGIDLPLIKDIPYIGGILSGHNILVYLAALSVFVSFVLMYKTPFGLRLRGIGIKEIATQSVGVNSVAYKWAAILLGGVFCGIGGSFLTIGGASMFTEKISAGNGFLALAAIMIGNGNPVKTTLACLVFGYVGALSVAFQSMQIPSQIVLSLPYVFTVLLLVFSAVIELRKKRSKYAQ